MGSCQSWAIGGGGGLVWEKGRALQKSRRAGPWRRVGEGEGEGEQEEGREEEEERERRRRCRE